jgi:hypothetical protein
MLREDSTLSLHFEADGIKRTLDGLTPSPNQNAEAALLR